MTGFGGPAATTGQLIAKPTTQWTAHTTAQPTVTDRDRLAYTQPTAQPTALTENLSVGRALKKGTYLPSTQLTTMLTTQLTS